MRCVSLNCNACNYSSDFVYVTFNNFIYFFRVVSVTFVINSRTRECIKILILRTANIIGRNFNLKPQTRCNEIARVRGKLVNRFMVDRIDA